MIRVFLLDDNALIKAGINGLLHGAEDVEVAGEASEFNTAMEVAAKDRWDVLWLSMAFAEKNGWSVLKKLRSLQPGLRTLLVGDADDPPRIINALKMGAAGYITRSMETEAYPKAIRKIAGGDSYVSEDLVSSLIDAMNYDGQDKALHDLLSEREMQVFMLIADGLRVTDIANELNISVKTVSTHRKNILGKLKLKTTSELVRYALKNGLLT